jgi:D-tyrosyl-tRNA(Tyr) deacylase
MRTVVQRVTSSSVKVGTTRVGAIGRGLVVFLGVVQGDDSDDADFLAAKLANLRIFADARGKLNRSLLETKGEMLVVSQFTLAGDCRKGRRPSFSTAAAPDQAERLYNHFVDRLRRMGVKVQTGRFGAEMAVELVNDGPVTLIVESK